MAGILDYQRNPSFMPSTIDGSMPSLPKQGGGLLGWFNDDPGATGGTSSGRAPLSGGQKQSLLFSGISDAIDSLQGRSGDLTQQMSNQYAQDYTKQSAERRRAAANKAISDAYTTGDGNAVRKAILEADPADVSHIHEALQAVQPKVNQVDPTRDTVSTDPLSGARTVLSRGVPKPEATPDIVQISQTLFPNDPKAQHDYMVKNSPSNLRTISNYNAPKENWQVLTDPKAGTQYRYDVNSGRAFTFDNKPYVPQGAAKIAGGSPRSPAMVYMGKFLEEHPNASVDEVQTAANKFRTGQSEAGTIGTRSGAADVASQEVSVFAKQALDVSHALPRTDYAALNSALQSWDMKTSNPNLRRLMIAADALVNARARAISPTGSPHVNDQLEGRKMLAASFANGDFDAAVDQISKEAEGVRSSTKASKDEFFGNKPPPSAAALPRVQPQHPANIQDLLKKYGQ